MMSTSSSSSNKSPSVAGLSDIGEGNKKERDDPQTTTITSWRDKITTSIQRSRKVRGGNFVQIATVDRTTMEPRCRTVVFRGFLGTNPSADDNNDYSVMKMITDRRSSKVSEATGGFDPSVDEGSNVEMVWWFQKSNEQYRIRGVLDFVGHDHASARLVAARKSQWGNLSDSAREQFYWKEPGVPFKEPDERDAPPVGGRGEDGKVLPPPDDFLLMLLRPKRVDYLRLGDNFRQVDAHVEETDSKGEVWSMTRMNP